MHDVAKHHAEQEGERHAGQKRGVRLLVVRNAVGVDDLLENVGELRCAETGRHCKFFVDFAVLD